MSLLPEPITEERRCPRVPIPINKLTVPLSVLVGFFLSCAGLFGTVGYSWFKTEAHAGQEGIHISVPEATRGGGLAYKNDLRDMEKQFRRTLKSMTLRCRVIMGETACSVDLPETP